MDAMPFRRGESPPPRPPAAVPAGPAEPPARGRGPRIAAAFAALALAGCPPRAPPPDLSLDPAELLGQVRSAQARVQSVRGEARIRMQGERGAGTVRAFVAARKPDRVYVETVDFFGGTVSVLAAAGGELSLYDAREKVVYRGAATAENVGRLVPIALSAAELAAILCGSAPLAEGNPVRAEPGRGHVTLEIAGAREREVLRVGAGAQVLFASRAPEGGGPGGWELTFRAFDALEGARFPGEIALSAREGAVSLRLTWVEVEAGAKVEDALFSPGVPRGARVVDLAAAAPPALLEGPRQPGE